MTENETGQAVEYLSCRYCIKLIPGSMRYGVGIAVDGAAGMGGNTVGGGSGGVGNTGKVLMFPFTVAK